MRTLLTVFSGLALRYWAITTMGIYWSFKVKRPSYLVTWGIYKWCAHPAYIGSLLLLDGIGRLLSIEPEVVVLGGLFYIWRAWREEQLMIGIDIGRVTESRQRLFYPVADDLAAVCSSYMSSNYIPPGKATGYNGGRGAREMGVKN